MNMRYKIRVSHSYINFTYSESHVHALNLLSSSLQTYMRITCNNASYSLNTKQ